MPGCARRGIMKGGGDAGAVACFPPGGAAAIRIAAGRKSPPGWQALDAEEARRWECLLEPCNN
jgi:hypothetical protein